MSNAFAKAKYAFCFCLGNIFVGSSLSNKAWLIPEYWLDIFITLTCSLLTPNIYNSLLSAHAVIFPQPNFLKNLTNSIQNNKKYKRKQTFKFISLLLSFPKLPAVECMFACSCFYVLKLSDYQMQIQEHYLI